VRLLLLLGDFGLPHKQALVLPDSLYLPETGIQPLETISIKDQIFGCILQFQMAEDIQRLLLNSVSKDLLGTKQDSHCGVALPWVMTKGTS